MKMSVSLADNRTVDELNSSWQRFEEAMADDDSPICSFYNGRNILVTGATGFMGKVLVEKLLRSCPGIKTIYLLLRAKNGLEPKQRLEEMLSAKLFDRVKQEVPTTLSKLVPINGDITFPGLGISEADVERLARDVSVVFHSAATVKFDEPLKRSVRMNVLGTRWLVQLCHKMPLLVALVHVSTAYCNCDREEVDEVVYPPPVAPQRVIEAMEWMDDDLVSTVTPHLIGDRPNTYTYTKALAENLLIDECGSLPAAIVRPSIVTAAWKEPVPGWVDNCNGPTGIIIAIGKGVLKSMLCYTNVAADLIPVDVVINLLVTVAWYTATHRPNNIVVYNCTSGSVNKTTWADIQTIAIPVIQDNPSMEVFRFPGGSFKASRFWNDISMFFLHYVPFCLIDMGAYFMGRKPGMLKLYHKLQRGTERLEYFTTHEWTFHCNNVLMLLGHLQGKDKNEFNFDIRNLEWDSYWKDYVIGIRSYILKEDLSSLPEARKRLRRVHIVGHIVNIFLLLGLWRVLVWRSRTARKVQYSVLSQAVLLFSKLFPTQTS